MVGGIIADLHSVAELGTGEGMQIILNEARRQGVVLHPAPETDDEDAAPVKHEARQFEGVRGLLGDNHGRAQSDALDGIDVVKQTLLLAQILPEAVPSQVVGEENDVAVKPKNQRVKRRAGPMPHNRLEPTVRVDV